MEDIGNKQAFPIPSSGWKGMTYRMWLIGKIASSNLYQWRGESEAPDSIISIADGIIKQLNEEKK